MGEVKSCRTFIKVWHQ